MGDIVVEGDDRARQVKRRVQSVCKIITEVIVLWCCGGSDAVSLREVCRVDLLLLVSVRYFRLEDV